MKNGFIHSDAPDAPVEVEYDLWIREGEAAPIAGGRIHIAGNTLPGLQFTDPVGSSRTLQTESGATLQVVFDNPNGAFVCQSSEEAKAALGNEK